MNDSLLAEPIVRSFGSFGGHDGPSYNADTLDDIGSLIMEEQVVISLTISSAGWPQADARETICAALSDDLHGLYVTGAWSPAKQEHPALIST